MMAADIDPIALGRHHEFVFPGACTEKDILKDAGAFTRDSGSSYELVGPDGRLSPARALIEYSGLITK